MMGARHYTTLARFTPEEAWAFLGDLKGVSSWVDPTTEKRWIVRLNSKRYHTFNRSMACVACGAKGAYFLLQVLTYEADRFRAHFNLFTETGQLMTKDHIIPVSKGGTEAHTNFQTMCVYCNSRKGNKLAYEMDLKTIHVKNDAKFALEATIAILAQEGRLVIEDNHTKMVLIGFLQEVKRHRETATNIHKMLSEVRKKD